MSDGLWWRKVKRGIIRDDHLEQVAYSLPAELRPLVISWYMVAYMLADDDGVFDFEDGGIFALRCFSSTDDVIRVKELMEKKGVIQNVIGGKSSFYLITDWIDVADGSQYNIRPSQTQEQRRAKVARKIEAEQKAKAAAKSQADESRKTIAEIKKGNFAGQEIDAPDLPMPEPMTENATYEGVPELPVDVVAQRVNNFLNFLPDSDKATKIGEMSKQTQDRTEQNTTEQHSTTTAQHNNSTAEESTAKEIEYAAVAADMPSADADGLVNDKEDIHTERADQRVELSHYDHILSTLMHFFDEKLSILTEKDRMNELGNLKTISDRLNCYVNKRNSGAAIVSVYLSAVKKHPDYNEATLPSHLLKTQYWNYTDVITSKILSIPLKTGDKSGGKSQNDTKIDKDSG